GVARTLGLEGVFEIIIVPRSEPQTKPKACNFALRFARGKYLVIYDAEDRPEPDQLRKVVATFRRSPPNTACLQCRLNYYNATEDADLGIRIGQKGYRVGVVDSTTYEEASCRTAQWLGQRSRWIKGYMQTLLVHTRRPLRLIRTVGLLGSLGFVFFIGGTVLTGLLNPVFWLFYAIWLAASAANLDVIFPQSLLLL